MMNIIKSTKIVMVLIPLSLLLSCNDFGNINDNPDTPTTVEPPFLITNTLYTLANQTTKSGFIYSSILMQYMGKYDFNTIDQYKLEANSTVWTKDYKHLGDLNDVLASKKANPSVKAIATILKAIVGAQLTDLYGPVPFFEAGNKRILKPRYNSQKDIYTARNGVLDLLSKAVTTLSSNSDLITGDILFHGNKKMWIKFANVLQLRYLLRIAAKYPDAPAKIREIVASNKLFSADENAILAYTEEPNNWYLAKEREGDFKLFRTTTTILKKFKDRGDPRVSFYYKTNSSNQYVGISPGSSTSGDYTVLSDNYRAADVIKMVYATYFQQEFILAEAALKNYIDPSTAQTHYENGVRAAFKYRNIPIPADYLSNPTKGKWDGTLKNLITQKYLANIMIGYQSWFDYRRTGYPELSPALDNFNSDKIPVRFEYPKEETFSNKKNNDAAIILLGANDYNSKSWWDK